MSGEDNSRQNGEKRELKGLYKGVRVSVRTLDLIIICCVVFIVLLLAFDLRTPGFTISFESLGGSDVPAQRQMYGEKLALPEPPEREGYSFTGWYTDRACYELWDVEERIIEGEVTLYAGWEKKSE